MFDIGFTEMLVIAVVALVVLGPDKLPKVAKQAGQWIGKLQRYVNDVKGDINRQMELEELRKLQTEVKDAAQSIESSVNSSVSSVQGEFDALSASTSLSTPPGADTDGTPTDWDRIYADRRTRERIKDRKRERDQDLGNKRPKRPFVNRY
jgi:sec-independent protein translocase protein TatB